MTTFFERRIDYTLSDLAERLDDHRREPTPALSAELVEAYFDTNVHLNPVYAQKMLTLVMMELRSIGVDRQHDAARKILKQLLTEHPSFAKESMAQALDVKKCSLLNACIENGGKVRGYTVEQSFIALDAVLEIMPSLASEMEKDKMPSLESRDPGTRETAIHILNLVARHDPKSVHDVFNALAKTAREEVPQELAFKPQMRIIGIFYGMGRDHPSLRNLAVQELEYHAAHGSSSIVKAEADRWLKNLTKPAL